VQPHKEKQQQQQHAVAKANNKSAEGQQQKQKKAKKAKKVKKGKKTAAKKSGRKSAVKSAAGRQSGGSCLAANCLDLAVAYIGVLRTKVTNYQKQVTRIGKLNSTAGGKAGKQNAFATTRNHLINQGGGNVSNMTCGTSNSNAGLQCFFLQRTETVLECIVFFVLIRGKLYSHVG
jgi:hypothetical protein